MPAPLARLFAPFWLDPALGDHGLPVAIVRQPVVIAPSALYGLPASSPNDAEGQAELGGTWPLN